MPKLKESEFTEKQDQFIYNLVRLGNNPTQSARLAGYADPKQSAFNLVHSPKIIARIRQERQKLYQTDLAPLAISTMKNILKNEDGTAPSASQIACCRLVFELTAEVGKHSQASNEGTKKLEDMSSAELSAVIDQLDLEKIKLSKDVTPKK